jgi:hypothetical protein
MKPKLSKSIRIFIRREKMRLRKGPYTSEEYTEHIKELYQKFKKEPVVPSK